MDSRRGGHDTHSFDGNELPVGLNSSWAIRLAWAPWFTPLKFDRIQNELFRLALRLWLSFKMLVTICERRQAPVAQVWCRRLLHSKSSQQNDWSDHFHHHPMNARKEKGNWLSTLDLTYLLCSERWFKVFYSSRRRCYLRIDSIIFQPTFLTYFLQDCLQEATNNHFMICRYEQITTAYCEMANYFCSSSVAVYKHL